MTYPPRRRWSFFDIDFGHREWSFLPTMMIRCWFVRNPNHYFCSVLQTKSNASLTCQSIDLCEIELDLNLNRASEYLLTWLLRWFELLSTSLPDYFADSSFWVPPYLITSLIRASEYLITWLLRWFELLSTSLPENFADSSFFANLNFFKLMKTNNDDR